MSASKHPSPLSEKHQASKTTGASEALTISIVFFLFLISPAGLSRAQPEKLTLVYRGSIGALIALAAEKEGYFAQEGLEVTKIPLGETAFPAGLKEKKAAGGIFDSSALVSASQDEPLVFTAGLYSGFLEIAGRLPDKDEIILAVPGPISGPAVAAAGYFRSLGIDPEKKIRWLTTAPNDLIAVVLSGKADALARWQPARPDPSEPWDAETPPAALKSNSHHSHYEPGQPEESRPGHNGHSHSAGSQTQNGPLKEPIANDHAGDYQIIYQARARLPAPPPNAPANPHALHTADHHFYDSFAVLDQDFVKENRAAASALTRALIRGARWIGENPKIAALLAADNGLTEDPDSFQAELGSFMWMPGISQAKMHLKAYIKEGILRGSLPTDLDAEDFFEEIFVQVLPDFN
ncbi:MAG: hypothetical protein LBP22_15575 [Deltaproteobacteria bacterium]|jgi:ABC-type nitrate/sulfonate/bicarbonate transport system substrate-binding protein|nr:hypothetical protein [Deltaproteobacteria bacterium]